MLGFKMLGALLIIGVGILAARMSAKHEKERLAVLDGWIGLILYIRGQIDCYLMPLNEILATADKTLLRTAGAGQAQKTLPDLFQAAYPYLSGESRRLLSAWIRELGSSYREEQLKRCDYFLAAMEKERDRLACALPARLKVSAALCLCTAIGTAILLW